MFKVRSNDAHTYSSATTRQANTLY